MSLEWNLMKGNETCYNKKNVYNDICLVFLRDGIDLPFDF